MDSDAVSAELSEQPFDVAFHPTQPLLAAALITGGVELFSYNAEARPRRKPRDKKSFFFARDEEKKAGSPPSDGGDVRMRGFPFSVAVSAAPLPRSQEATRTRSIAAHSDSCRAAQFSPDGALLLTGSLDRSIAAVDVATGAVAARLQAAHPAGINRLLMLSDRRARRGSVRPGLHS